MPWVSWGNITGTTGRKLRIEGININLSQDTVHSLTGTIMYRTHVQDIGWTGWKTLGQYSGTSCRAKQVEAIEIKLTGQLATFTCWYYTQFYGNYLFHSVLYNRGSMTHIQDGTLGKQVSHGCVRLDINNAKWLYDNIPNGTKVVIY